MPATADDSSKPGGMPRFLADDPEHWRQRGEQMRLIARGMSDAKTKKIMLGIAEFLRRAGRARGAPKR